MSLDNYTVFVDTANYYIRQSLSVSGQSVSETQKFRYKAIETYNRLLELIDITDYLLIDNNPIVPRNIYLDVLFNTGTLYKTTTESEIEIANNVITDDNIKKFRKAIALFYNILQVDFENINALKQIVSIYTILCYLSQKDLNKCLGYLQESLLYVPDNETIHYNLGFIYQRLNRIEPSLIHYKISLGLIKNKEHKEEQTTIQLLLNNYNGISYLYRSIKRWPEALYYLQKAEKVDSQDPDVQNQLGIVYTEMRRTDLAQKSYTRALDYVDKCFISRDPNFLTAEILLNNGHMHSYNGDNESAVDCYNKSLKIIPTFNLPFQNKIMNLNYLFDKFSDPMYITDQHKLINKLYKKNNYYINNLKKLINQPKKSKINIGIVSGDFVDHPVSFFISTFLKNYDTSKFTVTCYSECVIDTSIFNKSIIFRIIRNMSAEAVSKVIFDDKIDILFDLAGHTSHNRIDVFAMKPAPVQISYIGYPFTTGLNEMDYRITDDICDNLEVSQKFYTEKLITLPNCFLCYDPSIYKRVGDKTTIDSNLPKITTQPFLKNDFISIGCFNRINKITDKFISFVNGLLLKWPNIKFYFKTKALINRNIEKSFLSKFDHTVLDRIIILDCTILHVDHLSEYNRLDFAIDTFPYSGTTTSCEALLMGVPVFTLYDQEYYFHPQNVTASILRNSDLDFYVLDNLDQFYSKFENLQKNILARAEIKTDIRNKFLGGKVCNKTLYMNNIENLLVSLYDKIKIE